MANKHDPMLQKMISSERRAEEIRLINEYVAAGKVKRIDYVPPQEDELSLEEMTIRVEESLREFNSGREQIGDGNYRKTSISEG